MEDNIDTKVNTRDKSIFFFKENKKKIILIFSSIIIFTISFSFLKIKDTRNNLFISEKFIEAGALLEIDEEKSINIYEEIINSKNKIYSILALNTLLEKKLEDNHLKVLKHFETVESIKLSKEQRNLLEFKKALFLLNISKFEEGNKLIQKIIDSDSEFKSLAEKLKLNK